MLKHLCLTLCTLLLTACVEVDLPTPDPPCLIIEGFIDHDGFPTVLVSVPINVQTQEQDISSIYRSIIRWAKVSVECDGVVYPLTGMTNKGFFPPFIYTTTALHGEAGKTYTLRVQYNSLYAEATTTIPRVPDVQDIKISNVPGKKGNYQIHAIFRDFPNERNYYAAFARVGARTLQYTISHMGLRTDDGLPPNQDIEFPIYRGFSLDMTNFNRYFEDGDTISVKFAQVDSVSYQCLYDFENQAMFAANIFFPGNKNLTSNIKGGRGFWCGLGSTQKKFYLPKKTPTSKD